MIIRKKQSITIISFLSIILIFSPLIQLSRNINIGYKQYYEPTPGYRITSTDGIVIDEANISSYSSSGTGAIDDPFIIDDLYVNTTDSLGIEFSYVTSYFVLRDSYVRGSTYGVILIGVTSGRSEVINCTIEGAFSIGGSNSHYMTVHNNTLRSDQGSSFSRGLNFTENIVEITGQSTPSALRISAENNILSNNIFSAYSAKIRLNAITNSSIENNILVNAGFYIYEDSSENILNNSFHNNYINGKPYGFFYNRLDEVISGNQYGQIYLINSINIMIEDYVFNNVPLGVQVHNSTNVVIKNVNITGRNGIESRSVENLVIEMCNFYGKNYGIDIMNTNHVIIRNNYFDEYEYGIYGYLLDDVQIYNNTIFNTTYNGIIFDEVYNIVLKFNIISCFVESEGNEMALYILTSENVTIYYNIFISLGDLMAYPVEEDTITNIKWYNETIMIGNYYSDWNGLGTYNIEGDVGSVDLYPFIDIDQDSLTEFEEVIIYFTDPFNADTDSDGLDDGEEINTHNTDPLLKDSDSDGMDDYWEVTYETDPNEDDSDEDPDDDGLTNIEELNAGTLPMNNDTDSDGYLDGEEIEGGTDPLDSSSFPSNLNLGLIIGIATAIGAVVGISTYILIKKRKKKVTPRNEKE